MVMMIFVAFIVAQDNAEETALLCFGPVLIIFFVIFYNKDAAFALVNVL